jgi:hypothetical protein
VSLPTERQLNEVLLEIESHLSDIRLGILDRSQPPGKQKRWSLSIFDLMARSKGSAFDGFPPARGDGAGGRSGELAYSDPVGTMVVGDQVDRVAEHWDTVWSGILEARDALRRMVNVLAAVTPEDPPTPAGGCRVCGAEAVYALERCRWCYDWQRAQGVDPPPLVVQARREGRRITTKLVAEAEAAARQERKPKGKRRR